MGTRFRCRSLCVAAQGKRSLSRSTWQLKAVKETSGQLPWRLNDDTINIAVPGAGDHCTIIQQDGVIWERDARNAKKAVNVSGPDEKVPATDLLEYRRAYDINHRHGCRKSARAGDGSTPGTPFAVRWNVFRPFQVLAEGVSYGTVQRDAFGRLPPPNLFDGDNQQLPVVGANVPILVKVTNSDGSKIQLNNFVLESLSNPCCSGKNNFVMFEFCGLKESGRPWDIAHTAVASKSLKANSAGAIRFAQDADKCLADFVCSGQLLSWYCHRGLNSDTLDWVKVHKNEKTWDLPIEFRWNGDDATFYVPSLDDPDFLLFEEIAGRFALRPFWKECELRRIKDQDPERLIERLTKVRFDDVVDRQTANRQEYDPDDKVIERVYVLYESELAMVPGQAPQVPGQAPAP